MDKGCNKATNENVITMVKCRGANRRNRSAVRLSKGLLQYARGLCKAHVPCLQIGNIRKAPPKFAARELKPTVEQCLRGSSLSHYTFRKSTLSPAFDRTTLQSQCFFRQKLQFTIRFGGILSSASARSLILPFHPSRLSAYPESSLIYTPVR